MPNQTYYERKLRGYRLELRKWEKEYNSLPRNFRREREQVSRKLNFLRHKVKTAKIKLNQYKEKRKCKPKQKVKKQ